LREARAELARLRAEQKETRTRLVEARKAGGGKAGGWEAADEEE
jgi:hypothetical protein